MSRRPVLPDASRELFPSNPFTFTLLRTLSQQEARLTLFSSIASALFAQNTGGGVGHAMVASILPYTLSPLFATLTKTAGVRGHSSHSGTRFQPRRMPRLGRLLNVLTFQRSDVQTALIPPSYCRRCRAVTEWRCTGLVGPSARKQSRFLWCLR